MIGNIKGTIDKVASRKLAVTAVAGAAAATGAIELTWPMVRRYRKVVDERLNDAMDAFNEDGEEQISER